MRRWGRPSTLWLWSSSAQTLCFRENTPVIPEGFWEHNSDVYRRLEAPQRPRTCPVQPVWPSADTKSWPGPRMLRAPLGMGVGAESGSPGSRPGPRAAWGNRNQAQRVSKSWPDLGLGEVSTRAPELTVRESWEVSAGVGPASASRGAVCTVFARFNA